MKKELLSRLDNLSSKVRRAWTKEEDDFLREAKARKIGARLIYNEKIDIFNGRTEAEILWRMKNL